MKHKDLIRFWSKVNKRGPIPKNRPRLGRCWVWLGWKFSPSGRPGFDCNPRKFLAYRVSYQEAYGKIPRRKTIDHLCCNVYCVRPSHLEAVSSRVNTFRCDHAPATINSRKVSCPKGHLLHGANLYRYSLKQGRRLCLICRRERNAAWMMKKSKLK